MRSELGSSDDGDEPLCVVIGEEFLDYLCDCSLSKKGSSQNISHIGLHRPE
jgi:hypothetical protein